MRTDLVNGRRGWKRVGIGLMVLTITVGNFAASGAWDQPTPDRAAGGGDRPAVGSRPSGGQLSLGPFSRGGGGGGSRPAMPANRPNSSSGNQGGMPPASPGGSSGQLNRPPRSDGGLGPSLDLGNRVRPTGPSRNTPPSLPGQSDRPAARSADRPSFDRPMTRSADRPNADGPVTRSGNRPSLDRPNARSADRPSADRPTPRSGNRPSPNLPTARSGDRPNSDRPSSDGPVARSDDRPRPNLPTARSADLPNADRPNADRPMPRSGNRPSLDRPNARSNDRPRTDEPRSDEPSPGSNADRPVARSGDRPAADSPSARTADRPSGDRPLVDRPGNDGPLNLPSNWVRPTSPSSRPAGSALREPALVDRPDRPVRGGVRPGIEDPFGRSGLDRPRLRSVNNNTIIVGNTTNIINNWNIGLGSDPYAGWSRGYWNGCHVNDYWYSHHIHGHHHHWYQGCWYGRGSTGWYVPLTVGVSTWGLRTWSVGWGYGVAYYNPYCLSTYVTPYDYSRPVVVVNVVSPDSDDDEAEPAEDPAMARGMRLFDEGLEAFRRGRYELALERCDRALKEIPGDPVIHEVRGLSLFALGRYTEAAAVLNSLLGSAPGMDWASLSRLYGDADDYAPQLRALERFIDDNPGDASARFVLAYHYLVLGEADAAREQLREVVTIQPRDVVARRMLEALEPEDKKPARPVPPPPRPGDAEARDAADEELPEPAAPPEVDLVGTWVAKNDGTEIELTIDDSFAYVWKTKPAEGEPVEIRGELGIFGESLVFENEELGNLVGRSLPESPDRFRFVAEGADKDDPGLQFERRR